MGSVFLTKDAQIPTYVQEGGVGLDIDRCISTGPSFSPNPVSNELMKGVFYVNF